MTLEILTVANATTVAQLPLEILRSIIGQREIITLEEFKEQLSQKIHFSEADTFTALYLELTTEINTQAVFIDLHGYDLDQAKQNEREPLQA